MSSFSFLHAADLHLGSPLSGLAVKDADVAARFANAGREAFSDLVGLAIARQVAFVVIAGDVFDGEWRDTSIGLFFNREVARLDRAGIPVFLTRGNHDAESVVTKTITLPGNVSYFPSSKARTLRLAEHKVALHGRSFSDRCATENYALGYPDPVPGWFNVGILHTSCDGRPPHANYAPCSVQDLVLRGYDYWALGHVHEHEVLSRDPWIVFPGNLQGRSVRECGPKGAVLIEVADAQVTGVERLVLDRARWAELPVDLDGVGTEAEMLQKVEAAARPVVAEADGRLVALRVSLCGQTPLHAALHADPHRLADEIQAIVQRSHADVWLEAVKVRTHPPQRPAGHGAADVGAAGLDLESALDDLERDPELRAAAQRIVAAIAAKLPAGAAADDAGLADGLDQLLADARALVAGRMLNPSAT